MAIDQLRKSKYYATHLGLFNERQLTTMDGILNKAMRQALDLLPNFLSEEIKRPLLNHAYACPPCEIVPHKWEFNTSHVL